MKLYISAFELDVDGLKGMPQPGLDFVKALQEAGYQTYMPLEWRKYEIIEAEIDGCDGLLALADEYWLSSTWKTSELTYALNGDGVASVNPQGKPMPTFVYWIDAPIELRFLQHPSRNQPVYLSQDHATAIREIDGCVNRLNP